MIEKLAEILSHKRAVRADDLIKLRTKSFSAQQMTKLSPQI